MDGFSLSRSWNCAETLREYEADRSALCRDLLFWLAAAKNLALNIRPAGAKGTFVRHVAAPGGDRSDLQRVTWAIIAWCDWKMEGIDPAPFAEFMRLEMTLDGVQAETAPEPVKPQMLRLVDSPVANHADMAQGCPLAGL